MGGTLTTQDRDVFHADFAYTYHMGKLDKTMELPLVALRCHENSLLVSENVTVGGRQNR